MKYFKALVLFAFVVMLRYNTMLHRLVAGGFQDIVMKNTVHYLTCEELPTKQEVQQVYDRHIDVIERIEREADLYFSVSDVQEETPTLLSFNSSSHFCEGKGQLFSMIRGERQRRKALQIINSDRFFGIPYTIINN